MRLNSEGGCFDRSWSASLLRNLLYPNNMFLFLPFFCLDGSPNLSFCLKVAGPQDLRHRFQCFQRKDRGRFHPLFLCIVHWRRLFYLSLLISGTLHSDGYIFPFFICLSLLFYLFVRCPKTTVLPFCISFSWWWFFLTSSCMMFQISVHSFSGNLSIRSNLLNLFCHFHCIIIRHLN